MRERNRSGRISFPAATQPRLSSSRRRMGMAALFAAAAIAAPRLAAADPQLPMDIGPTVYNVTEANGGVAGASLFGGATASTSAADNSTIINDFIAYASENGGGTVEIPQGTYDCSGILMQSNVNLQVDTGATIDAVPAFSNPTAYATLLGVTVPTGEPSAHDIEISGGGVFDGMSGPSLLASLNGINDLEINGVTFQNSGLVTMKTEQDNNVTINGITINGPDVSNADGIDLSGSHFLIENSSVSDGDDDIAVKPASTFCSDITINNCTIGTGHGIAIGGQTPAGLDGLTINDCTFINTTEGFHFKSGSLSINNSSHPGGGGIVNNITVNNITMTNVKIPIIINSWYGSAGDKYGSSQGTTPVPLTNPNDPQISVNEAANSPENPFWDTISFSNVTATGGAGNAAIIYGLNSVDTNQPADPPQNIDSVSFNNVNLSAAYGADIFYTSNLNLSGLNVTAAAGPNINAVDNTVINTATIVGAQTFSDGDSNPAGTNLFWFDNAANPSLNGNITLNGTYTNYGTFNAQVNRNFVGSGMGIGSFDNAAGGTFNASPNDGTTAFNVPVTNEGVMAVGNGTLEFNNGLTSSGTLNVSETAYDGPTAVSASTANLTSTSVVNIVGGAGLAVSGDLNNAGTLNVAGTENGPYPGSLTVQGTLANSGTLNLSLTSVTINNLTMTTTSTINASGGSQITVNSGAMTNNGSLNLSDAALVINGTSASLVNNGNLSLSGGFISLNTQGSPIPGTLTNNGVMTIQGTDQSQIVGASIVNNGTLNFDQSGTFTYSSGISGGGAINQNGTGTTILSGNSDSRYGPGITGTTTINAGTLEIAGEYSGAIDNEANLVISGTPLDLTSLTLGPTSTTTVTSSPDSELNIQGTLDDEGILNIGPNETVNTNKLVIGSSGTLVLSGDGFLSAATAIGSAPTIINGQITFGGHGAFESGENLVSNGTMTVLGNSFINLEENTDGGSLTSNGTLLAGPQADMRIFSGGGPTILGASSETEFQIGASQDNPYIRQESGGIQLGGSLAISLAASNFGQPSSGVTYTLFQDDDPNGTITQNFTNIANGLPLVTLDGLHSFDVHYGSDSATPNAVTLDNFQTYNTPQTLASGTTDNVANGNNVHVTTAANQLGQVDAMISSTSGGTFTSTYYQAPNANLTIYGAGPADFELPGSAGIVQLWDLHYTDASELTDVATITLHFDPTGMTLSEEEDLEIEHWVVTDGVGAWQFILPSVPVDTVHDTITFDTSSFSPFALAEVPEPASAGLLAITAFAALLRRRRRKMMNVRYAEIRNSNDE